MVYAGFWRRFAAHVIDWAVISMTMWIVMVPFLIIGGVLVGSDLIDAAERRQVKNMTPHSEIQTIHKIVPLSNEMTLAQATPAATEQPLTYSTPMPEIANPTTPVAVEGAATQAPKNTEINPTNAEQSPYGTVSPPYPPSANTAANISSVHTAQQAQFDQFSPFILLLNTIVYLVMFGVGLAYHTYFVGSKWQATPGKRVMHCAVVTKDGQRLSYGHALGRHVLCLISWAPFLPPFFIGYYLAGWTREKTALHDMICGSRVVRTQEVLPTLATR